MYTSCTFYCLLIGVYIDIDWLMVNCTLLHFCATCSATDPLFMCILHHVLDHFIGSVLVRAPVSVLLLSHCRLLIELDRFWSAWFGLSPPLLRCLWSHNLLIVKRRGRWWLNEVGSPEKYIVSFKSKWNEWQPTCRYTTWYILLHIATGCRGYSPFRNWQVIGPMLFVSLHTSREVNGSWIVTLVRYKLEILQWKGRLTMFVSRHLQHLT
jgi:hypothetical protein